MGQCSLLTGALFPTQHKQLWLWIRAPRVHSQSGFGSSIPGGHLSFPPAAVTELAVTKMTTKAIKSAKMNLYGRVKRVKVYQILN